MMFEKGTKLAKVLSSFDTISDVDIFVEKLGLVLSSHRTFGYLVRSISDSLLYDYVVDYEDTPSYCNTIIYFSPSCDVTVADCPDLVSLSIADDHICFMVFERGSN